jgi:hypothetical protein
VGLPIAESPHEEEIVKFGLVTSPQTDAAVAFLERHCADCTLFAGPEYQPFLSLAAAGDMVHAVKEYKKIHPGASVGEGKFAATVARARRQHG